VIVHTIETRIHGRYLIEPAMDQPAPLLVGFHGYAETAEPMLTQLTAFGDGWSRVSIQALHRFYNRSQDVVANWMTRQDRDLEIAANVEYVTSVIRNVQRDYSTDRPIVFVGFSQGVAMAYRAAVNVECQGVIALAGDVPPDVVSRARTLPPILIGRGNSDRWYTEEKAAADLRTLADADVRVVEHVFEGGHAWGASFVIAARDFLRSLETDARRGAP